MIPLLPLVVPWLVGTVLLFVNGCARWVSWLAAAILAASAVLELVLLVDLSVGDGHPLELVTGNWPQGIGIRLYVDRLALFFGVITAGVLAVVLVHEVRVGVRSRLFPGLLLLLGTGLHGAYFTGDLFNFYVFFELAVVSSFALASYGFGRKEVRGALIYVAVNLFGSMLFLVGVASLYHEIGTLDFEQIQATVAGGGRVMVMSAALLFAALSVKLGLFPFHGWVPVLYSHARPAVAAALSGALVNIGAYGLLRLGTSVLDVARDAGAVVLVVVGLVATGYGALLALRRRDPAEFAAYTSVVHAGYLVFALGIGGVDGAAAILLTVLAGSVDKTAMFLALDLRGRTRARLALIIACGVAGLPFTLGMLSKLQLFRAALASAEPLPVTAAFLVSAALVLAAAFRFVALARRDERVGGGSVWPVAVLMTSSVVLGVVAEPVVRIAYSIALELTRGGS